MGSLRRLIQVSVLGAINNTDQEVGIKNIARHARKSKLRNGSRMPKQNGLNIIVQRIERTQDDIG
jgi:hypothetical protein